MRLSALLLLGVHFPWECCLLYSCAGSERCLLSCLDDILEADESARTVVTYSTPSALETRWTDEGPCDFRSTSQFGVPLPHPPYYSPLPLLL